MNDKITFQVETFGAMNLAMQQNYVPLVRNILIKNNSDEEIKNVILKISFEPEFAKEYTHTVDVLPAHTEVEVSPVKIVLSTEFLFSLTERMVAQLSVELWCDDELISSDSTNIDLLAFDQWTGCFLMPELIAAFVTPNHPTVSNMLSKASEYMAKWGKRPEITGYLTRSADEVKVQMAAIYAALQSQNIVYNNVPPSYERLGQRVRLPYSVIENRQGTCLDLAVTYASCLEAAGLHPLIMFEKGHAYCGCRLEEETFADCVIDDYSAIDKRTVSGNEDILLVECTDFTASKNVDFDKAVKHGKDNLLDSGSFICAVDVRRSRAGGLRPIPQKIANNQFQGSAGSDTPMPDYQATAPQALNRSQIGVIDYEEGSLSRVQMWERKLLDFSLRNSLLNFKITKNALPLLTYDLALLEDSLSDGISFAIRELPSEWTRSLRDARLYEIENENDLATNIAREEFKSKRICAVMHAEELEKSLKNIYRTTKTSLEENGSNTLFLALGFLKWYESDISEKPRYAPLIMIPVELVKSSHNKGYVLRSRQEETQINVTLIEYLRQIFELKVPSLDPLPEDEHGTDIPLVFNTIRNCILDKKRWNVVDTACLGQFSFGQFVMWNDLRNRADELKQNKVVSGLIDKKIIVEHEENPLKVTDLDERIAPDDLAIPLSADSSQMLAIAEAAKGKSFVLHGPPGTGKSQTITNLIANALYHGKSVLFVAEKMAALNVVQHRLENIGLAPFCLELHSNKASKSSVLSQLEKSLEVGRIKHPEKYKASADRLKAMRAGMNGVIDGLHKKHDSNISVYDAIEQYESYADFKNKVIIPQELVSSITEDKIDLLSSYITGYANSVDAVGDIVNNPLKDISLTEYSIPLREQIYSQSLSLLNLYSNAKASIDKISDGLNLNYNYSEKNIADLLNLCKTLLINSAFSPTLTLDSNYNSLVQKLNAHYNNTCAENNESQELEKVFTSGIYQFNPVQALNDWNAAQSSWILSRISKQKKLLKDISQYCIIPNAVTKENITEWYQRLISFNKLHSDNVKSANELCFILNELGADFKNAIDKTNAVYNALMPYNDYEKRAILSSVSRVNLSQLSFDAGCVENYLMKWKVFADTVKVNLHDAQNADLFKESNNILENLSKNIDKLYVVTEYNANREKLRNENLECICNAVESGVLDKSDAVSAFKCNIYYALALKYISSDESLSTFRSNSFEQTIKEYHSLIDEYSQLTVQELVATLSAQVPVSGSAGASSSELGLLKRAIKSNGRAISIRKLFNEIPELLRRLCPCMLMSPISVAQYIDQSFPKFDLVVFDEASQLPTSEAVGTIARGENVVVVGDPNQLPPTSFFKSNRIDEENIENEDLESLLDDCLSISMPQMYLKWHYRSRHESLIAYSNIKYYDNKLYTFPSPNDRVSAVKLIHIDGYYDKGGTKQNKAEAEAVVNEIIRRLSDEELRTKSIGVVTFNVIQQNLIEDMLADEFSKHPELEKFDSESAEPVFVKNLENVQGDERDIILFSVGYGPDKNGKVSMNFGPLNRDGGWRRLNVAISRARYEMIVYSTLTPEQIDLSRTRALGVEGLKGFLKFAGQNRNIAVSDGTVSSTANNSVITEIAAAIEKLGYKVNCNIGCSEYKIDIGIVDPENSGNYLLGILADGENCKNSATSKDRFVLQPDVLAGLGWKIMRVWTLDWLDDSARVIDKIKSEIENAVANKNTKHEVGEQNKAKTFEFEKLDTSSFENCRMRKYEDVNIPILGNSDSFYAASAEVDIQKLMFKIISAQAPISKKSLYKSVLSAYGISRSGNRAEAILDRVLVRIMHFETSDNGVLFVWQPEQKPEEYDIYRVSEQPENKRSIDDISSNEILNASKDVLCEQGCMNKTDLIKETSKKFGFNRTGNLIDITIGYAVDSAITKGELSAMPDGKITDKT